MKLYTLRECFEKNGRKFPFIINMHYDGQITEITFDRAIFNHTDPDGTVWFPVNVSEETSLLERSDKTALPHKGYANIKAYSFIEGKFKKDLKTLLT